MEPDAKRLSYHILAMEDVTAHVGSYEQIIEALVKMSFYADLNKPILLHCYSGVGRSAMMTALHLAHRYLIGDTVVREAINTLRLGLEKTPLDPQHEDYISKLYYAATKFVAYHRTCCQFDSHKRNNQAIAILTELGRRLATGEPLIKHTGDDYHFLSSLTQSLEFKKLQYHYFHVFGAEKHVIKKLFDDMLWNAPDWHKKLADLAADKSPMQYYQIPDASHEKLRGLLSDVLAVIHRLAEQMPDVSYSQQTVAKQEAEVLQGFEEGCESSPRPFN